MPITLYRGDSRPPDPLDPREAPTISNSIRAAGGFHPWVPTTRETGRAIINRCIVPRGPAPDLPAPADRTNLQTLLRVPTVSLIDVLRDIKTEKSRRTVHLSTDTTVEAGGYASGYVYWMEFDLNVQALGQGEPLPVDDAAQLASRTRANVFFDGDTLADSNLFGISGGPVDPGVEAAFLTSIPLANIRYYCVPGITEVGGLQRPWIVF